MRKTHVDVLFCVGNYNTVIYFDLSHGTLFITKKSHIMMDFYPLQKQAQTIYGKTGHSIQQRQIIRRKDRPHKQTLWPI